MKLKHCEVCNFPLVDKHHLIPKSYYGDDSPIVFLCPNCHRLFHLIYNHVELESKTSKLGYVILEMGIGNERLDKLYNLVQKAHDLEIRISQQIMRTLNDK